MNKLLTVAVVVAISILTGCATMERFGVGDDAVEEGVQTFLKRQNLEGLVTAEQTKQFLAIVKADIKLQELAAGVPSNIEADVRLQERIAELGQRYILNGRFVDPAAATNTVVQ